MLMAVAATLGGCGGTVDEPTDSTAQEAKGAITLSGTIFGANGNQLSGVTVRLTGSAQATVTTGAAGTYSFAGLASGSYSIQPSLSGCTFVPSVVSLNKVTASTTVNFDGSGSSCGGTSSNSGATSGSLSISGVVTNAAGSPVRGVRVQLSGSTQAVRTTTAIGSYTFQVNPGSYSVTPTGPCTFRPTVANLNNLRASRTQDFVAGSGCGTVPDAGAGDSAADARPDTGDARSDTADAPSDAVDARPDTGDARLDTGDARPDTGDAPSDAVDATAERCVPTTCAAAGRVCGPLADGCGTTLQCGTCGANQTCDATGQCVNNCIPTTCAAAGRVCGPLADGCGNTLQCGTCLTGQTCDATGQCVSPCDVSTTDCMRAQDKSPSEPAATRCFQCSSDNGCLDPAQQGGTCEDVAGTAPASCASVIGSTATPSETQVCLFTLKNIFSSQCAATLQEAPCLCGGTDIEQCLAGTAVPTGALYPVYACDISNTVSIIVNDFTLPSFGTGQANAIVQCAAAFGCNCF
jgi:hypothetical protein